MLGVLVVLTKNYPDHCFFLFAKDIPQSLICSYNIFFFKKLFCWGQVKEEGMRDDLNPKAPLFVEPHKYSTTDFSPTFDSFQTGYVVHL